MVPEAGKCKIRVPAGLVSGEASPPWVIDGTVSLCAHMHFLVAVSMGVFFLVSLRTPVLLIRAPNDSS